MLAPGLANAVPAVFGAGKRCACSRFTGRSGEGSGHPAKERIGEQSAASGSTVQTRSKSTRLSVQSAQRICGSLGAVNCKLTPKRFGTMSSEEALRAMQYHYSRQGWEWDGGAKQMGSRVFIERVKHHKTQQMVRSRGQHKSGALMSTVADSG